jgi:hypothetical protein
MRGRIGTGDNGIICLQPGIYVMLAFSSTIIDNISIYIIKLTISIIFERMRSFVLQ